MKYKPKLTIMDGNTALDYVIKNKIEGAIVECGVDSANFEYEWIRYLKQNDIVRDIFMYDTFTGLTMLGVNDFTSKTATLYQMSATEVLNVWKSKVVNDKINTWCMTPLEHVQARLNKLSYDNTKLHYIVGDVLSTLKDPKNIPEKIAILRLDTDWYESSKIEMEVLFEKVVENGVVIFDDYLHWEGQRKAVDDFFTQRNLKYTISSIGNGKTASMIKTIQTLI